MSDAISHKVPLEKVETWFLISESNYSIHFKKGNVSMMIDRKLKYDLVIINVDIFKDGDMYTLMINEKKSVMRIREILRPLDDHVTMFNEGKISKDDLFNYVDSFITHNMKEIFRGLKP
ncbi:MAG: hypothetical protein QXJ81_01170 [Metallosphaera sp.]